jgi:hypothetical protein
VTDGSQNLAEWKWTANREKAAFALATAKNMTEASKECGVSRESLRVWLRHPTFKARVQEHLDENVAEARRILQRTAAQAAEMVRDITLFGNSRLTTRLMAAKDVLDRVGLKAPEKLEHGGPGGGPLRIVWTYGDPDEGQEG